MAITTNTGAKKIEGTENWRNIFDIHNDTVDAYDALAEQKDEETGIVVRGNKTTHADGAAAGQFVILRNSTITGCADGLYTAAKAIPYNTVIDSTYLTPCPEGGLNALNASSETVYASQEFGGMQLYRYGAVRVLSIDWVPYSTVHSVTIHQADRPTKMVRGVGLKQTSGGTYASIAYIDVGTDGSITAAKFDQYNGETGASYLGNSDNLSCIIVWIRA